MKTDVVILNWHTWDLVVESLLALRQEPDPGLVTIVDQTAGQESLACPPSGRREGIEEAARDLCWCLVVNSYNRGNSIGRNQGIAMGRAPFVFLLDGDIVYVPGSIGALREVLTGRGTQPCAPTVRLGAAGLHPDLCTTRKRSEASAFCDGLGNMTPAFIAPTQYGLFRREVFKACAFCEEGPFGEPGHGWEDDDLLRQMQAAGWGVVLCEGLKYYHERSSSQQWLRRLGLPDKFEERRAVFEARWK